MRSRPPAHGASRGEIRHVVMIRPEVGGVAYVAQSSANELRGRGIQVTELVGTDGGSPALDGARTAWAHRAQIRSADVVHLELGVTALSAFWIGVWASLFRRRLVTVVHDGLRIVNAPGSGLIRTRPGRRDAIAHKIAAPLLNRPLRALIVRRTRRWVALSDRSRSELEGAGLGAAVVLPIGADPPTSAARPSECKTVVFAGFISPAKGLDVLADAWEAVGPATNLRLVVVGNHGRQYADYAEAVRRRLESLDPTVSWSGWVNDDETFNAAIAEAAIVVLPYRRSNPASGILIRAAVEGRAIIGSSVPAVVDFLADGVTGLIVEPDDAEGLARALLVLATDQAARDALGAASARWAAEHCTWATQVDHLVAAYET